MKGLGVGINEQGNPALFKGELLYSPKFMQLDAARIARYREVYGNDWNGIATTDTVKFASPGKVYDLKIFWHDDVYRKETSFKVRLSTQMLLNTFDRFVPGVQDMILGLLEKLLESAKSAFAPGKDRSRRIGAWLNRAVLEMNENDEEDNSKVLALGDISKLMMETGLPTAWLPTGTWKNIEEALPNLVRSRSLGGLRIPGFQSKVVWNEHLQDDEVRIYGEWAKARHIEIGDMICTWKSPIGPRSVVMRRVAGFCGPWFETKAHYGHDYDGDIMAATDIDLVSGNWVANPAAEQAAMGVWDEALVANSKTYDLPKGRQELVETLFQGLLQTTEVGLLEYSRMALAVTGPCRELEAVIFEQGSEGVLISGKKHGSNLILDVKDLIKSLELPSMPAIHALLCGRNDIEIGIDEDGRTIRVARTPKTVREAVQNDYILDSIRLVNPTLRPFYLKALEIARVIADGLRITDEDSKVSDELRGAMLAVRKALGAGLGHDVPSNTLENIRVSQKLVDLDCNICGWLQDHKDLATAVRDGRRLNKKIRPENSAKIYRILDKYLAMGDSRVRNFRAWQSKQFEQSLTLSEDRLIALTGIIKHGVYAMIYWFRPWEIRKVIRMANNQDVPELG